jgi:hypothetical protein
MGITAIVWRCPRCNVDVGGSFGDLKYHWKNVHNTTNTSKSEAATQG